VKAGAASVEPRGKHSGIVEDDEIGGVEKIREFAELEVFDGSSGSGKTKHSRGRAIGKGLLRDQFRRKFELKIGDEHEERL
jgi:hypothetical protein